MPAGLPRIEVKFLIDANGILHVSAREQRSGKGAEIEVQPSYGLTDEQVEGMLLESFDFAEEDFRQRQVIEARREADTIFSALEKGRANEAWKRLTKDERDQITKLLAADAETYTRLCNTPFGDKGFNGVCSFLSEAKNYIPNVVATAVSTCTMPWLTRSPPTFGWEWSPGTTKRPKRTAEISCAMPPIHCSGSTISCRVRVRSQLSLRWWSGEE